MKTTLFAFLFAITGVAQAQQPGSSPIPRPVRVINPGNNNPSNAALPANYILGLTLIDRNQTASELSLVVATTAFHTNFLDNKGLMVTFSGTITPEDDGDLLISYTLATEVAAPEGQPNQNRSISVNTSVRLRPGTPVQVMQSPIFSCRLNLTALPDAAAKAH